MSAIPSQAQGNGLPSQPPAGALTTAPAAATAPAAVAADPATTEEEQAAADGTTADATTTAPTATKDDQRPNMDIPSVPEPKLPTRKDVSLKELLSKMDEYAPIVRHRLVHHLFPLTFHYLTRTTPTTPHQSNLN